MKNKFLLCSLLAILAFGCKPNSSVPPAKTYAARGVIQQIAPDHRHATIRHEAIPGYMAAMTMDFSVRDTNALAGFAAGDEITFSLVVTDNDDWIENLQRTGSTGGVTGPPGWHVVEPELKVGDALPDAEFTSENGRIIHLADFRGQAVAFTFFFTSCPLPEYCPRMNRNFSEARNLLLAETNAPANWQLRAGDFGELRRTLSRHERRPLAVRSGIHQHAGRAFAEAGFSVLARSRHALAQFAHSRARRRRKNIPAIRRQRLDGSGAGESLERRGQKSCAVNQHAAQPVWRF